ncbi:hypothetical protein [Metallibacterium scheffleri]|uniref:hypothetical protein n=1 Tax=Metallibacterium scheffleri TaxID=993689 RepID=UPI0009BE064F|nr:hypothetical protein [Metallibacterium scheffleri]
MNAQVLRQSWQLVIHNKPWLLWTCLLLTLLVVLVTVLMPTSDSPQQTRTAAYVIGIAASFAWALVVPRLLLWHRALRHMRVPRAKAVLAGSLTLCVALLPGLPLLALMLAAKPDALALAMVCFACLAALHWATGPVWLAIGMPAAQFGGMQFLIAGSNPTVVPLLWTLDALLVVYAVLRWRELLVLDISTLPCRKLPVIMRIADGSLLAPQSIVRTLEARQIRAPMRHRFVPVDASRNPAQTLRAWLGQPFASLTAKGELLGYGSYWLMAGATFMIAAWLHWASWAVWIGVWLVIPAFMIMSFQGQSRLYVLFTLKRGGEIAELSMLPGLGTSDAVRRNLLLASFGPVVTFIGLFTASLMLPALLLAAPLKVTLGILVLGIASIGWFGCSALHILAQRADDRLDLRRIALRLALKIPLVLLVVLTLMEGSGITAGMFGEAQAIWITRALMLAWALLSAFMILRASRDWRAFQRRPHPFLQR